MMAKLKKLGNRIGKEEEDRIMEEFRETLLDFCESCVPNGSRRGDEWDCSDIFNSERAEGDQGSCSINLVSGAFYDQNPKASPRKGSAYGLFLRHYRTQRGESLSIDAGTGFPQIADRYPQSGNAENGSAFGARPADRQR
jgi:hypothetical protein